MPLPHLPLPRNWFPAQPASCSAARSCCEPGRHGTVVINLPSGAITVKIDKGTLPVNTAVVVSVSGDKVVIQPLPDQNADQTAQSALNAAQLKNNPNAAAGRSGVAGPGIPARRNHFQRNISISSNRRCPCSSARPPVFRRRAGPPCRMP